MYLVQVMTRLMVKPLFRLQYTSLPPTDRPQINGKLYVVARAESDLECRLEVQVTGCAFSN